jgi:hypothetical protein
MTGPLLDITQPATVRDNALRQLSDSGPSTAMARTTPRSPGKKRRTTAQTFGVRLTITGASTSSEIEAASANPVGQGISALLLDTDVLLNARRRTCPQRLAGDLPGTGATSIAQEPCRFDWLPDVRG